MSHDLYTSQVHLKRVLAGQSTPAFTSAPAAVLKVLDPAFFPGLGALNEDEDGRLQCPVRGCGKYFTVLSSHLRQKHRALGGVKAIRRALDIPVRVPLISFATRKLSAETHPNLPRAIDRAAIRKTRHARVAGLKTARSQYRGRHSVHHKNMSDRCTAQLSERVRRLSDSLQRSPTFQDFVHAYGGPLAHAVNATFGSWNNAKALVGLSACRSGRPVIELRLVVESLREWVALRGDLPFTSEIRSRGITPQMPCQATIMRAFGVDTWEAAMVSAMQHLSLTSHRYGERSTWRSRKRPAQ